MHSQGRDRKDRLSWRSPFGNSCSGSAAIIGCEYRFRVHHTGPIPPRRPSRDLVAMVRAVTRNRARAPCNRRPQRTTTWSRKLTPNRIGYQRADHPAAVLLFACVQDVLGPFSSQLRASARDRLLATTGSGGDTLRWVVKGSLLGSQRMICGNVMHRNSRNRLRGDKRKRRAHDCRNADLLGRHRL